MDEDSDSPEAEAKSTDNEEESDQENPETPPRKTKLDPPRNESPSETSQMSDQEDPTTATPTPKRLGKQPANKVYQSAMTALGNASNPTPAPPAKASASKSSKEQSSDEDSDIEFEILEVDRKTTARTAGQQPLDSNKLITDFAKEPRVYHGDHMAPFRGIMGSKESADAKAKKINEKLKSNRSKKLLIAVTGRVATTDGLRTVKRTIKELRIPSPNVEFIEASPWFLVTVSTKENVETLINQKAVYDPLKKALVVFRKIQMKPDLTRVFEIKDIKFPSDLIDLRNYMTVNDAEVSLIKY